MMFNKNTKFSIYHIRCKDLLDEEPSVAKPEPTVTDVEESPVIRNAKVVQVYD